jgi:TonB family protein
MDAAGGRGVEVLESPGAPTAMTIGIFRPVVLLPADAREWPVDRLRAVLLHELMHVRRRDLASQAIAQGACCVYWFHPLAWLAGLRLRRERERACDDAVLGRGIAAHDYAVHLVALVRALRGRRSAGVTMAGPSEFESRVRALLDGKSDRRPLNRSAAFTIVAALVVVVLPLAVITRAQAAPPSHTAEALAVAAPLDGPEPQAAAMGSLSGTVEDPSAARIPNSEVRARNLDASNEEITHANSAGEYHFASIPIGRYELSVRSAGFKMLTTRALVEVSKAAVVSARLELGELSEAVTVSAARPALPAAIAAPQSPRRIRVGGNVQASKLLYKVPPVYPEELKAKGISGIVHLRAILTKQGYLTNLQVMNTEVDAGLAAAAMEAAAHWLYQPSLLNGQPVAVLTNIDISFELQ